MGPVDLLEHGAPLHVGVDRADNEQEGRRVDVRGGDADGCVRGAGANRGERHDRLSARAIIGIGQVGGALLVHDRDQLDGWRAPSDGVD